jgi:hypothetical protein
MTMGISTLEVSYTNAYNINIIDFSLLPIDKVPNVKLAKTEADQAEIVSPL